MSHSSIAVQVAKLLTSATTAELEREVIQERTRSGRVAAKARGVRFGRPPKPTGDQIALARRLVSEWTSIPEASKVLNVHRATLYRASHSEPERDEIVLRVAPNGPW
jgi:DNA invertase Pin-like site-specific DNA recombinase